MTTDTAVFIPGRDRARSSHLELRAVKRLIGWLGLAAALVAVAVAGSFTFTSSPLVFVYWDVGRLLPALWFPFQLAAIVVNAALVVAIVALARLIARLPALRRQPSPRASGVALIAAASIVVLLVYVYPHARGRLLVSAGHDGGSQAAAGDWTAEA